MNSDFNEFSAISSIQRFTNIRKKNFNDALKELESLSSIEILLEKILSQLRYLRKFQIIKNRNVFFNNSDRVDLKSNEILQKFTSVDLYRLRPVYISGDGNCLFRSLSKALYGNEEAHSELRYRTVVELTLRVDEFCEYNNRNKEEGLFYDLISPSSQNSQNSRNILINEIKTCSKINSWSSIWHLFGAAQAMKINIHQVHPTINQKMKEFLNKSIENIKNEAQCKILNSLFNYLKLQFLKNKVLSILHGQTQMIQK